MTGIPTSCPFREPDLESEYSPESKVQNKRPSTRVRVWGPRVSVGENLVSAETNEKHTHKRE